MEAEERISNKRDLDAYCGKGSVAVVETSAAKKQRADGDVDFSNSVSDIILSPNISTALDCEVGDTSETRQCTEKLAESSSDTTSRPDHIASFTNGDTRETQPSGGETPIPDEIAPLLNTIDKGPHDPPISKNQQKKLRKKQEWESQREERKATRKQKQIAKRERKKAARADQTADPTESPMGHKQFNQKRVQLPVTIMIDCDFDDLMRDNERISLAGQITRSYSDNKNAPFRAHLAICSFSGKLKERFENILVHHKGWRGVRFLPDDFLAAAERAREWMSDEQSGGKLAGAFAHLTSQEMKNDDDGATTRNAELEAAAEIVYLTSEAEETLTSLRPYSTYIVGGLVDKNREKGICYKRATKRGVRTARLPIGDFMDMQSRKVLTTNHVNEIMLRWLECGDWGEAFMKVIPKRKGGKLKGDDGEGEKGGDEDDGDVDGDDGEEGDEDEREESTSLHITNDDNEGKEIAS